jgi:hypothetical protein
MTTAHIQPRICSVLFLAESKWVPEKKASEVVADLGDVSAR